MPRQRPVVASPLAAVLLVAVVLVVGAGKAHGAAMSYDFYAKTCPNLYDIVRETVTTKQINNPSTAAGTLRLFLHDCLVSGCDASILITSTRLSPPAERDADINLSLPGDAFDLLTRLKTAAELACPETVSCADLLALATRDLVSMVGGPHYDVPLGRRDYRVSLAAYAAGRLPRPAMNLSRIAGIFSAQGFSEREMVALSGAHTIGFSHCSEFAPDLESGGNGSSGYDRRFAEGLRRACSDYRSNPALSVFNDQMTPGKFDNQYYKNLEGGLGLLRSDQAYVEDPTTRAYVAEYARDEDLFFRDFARAMVKLSLLGVKTGRRGEIRRRCDQVN